MGYSRAISKGQPALQFTRRRLGGGDKDVFENDLLILERLSMPIGKRAAKPFDFYWNIVVSSPADYCTVSLTVLVCCSDPLVAVTVNV
jgi:hypothetical protein